MTSSDLSWSRLIDFGNRLHTDLSAQSQSEVIVDFLQEIFECRAYAVLFDQVDYVSAIESFSRIVIPNHLSTLMREALERQKMQFISGESSHGQDIQGNKSRDILSDKTIAVAVPVISSNRSIGVFAIAGASGDSFSGPEIELLEFLAFYIAHLVIKDPTLLAYRKKIEILSLVRDVTSEITKLRTPEELSNSITRIIQEKFDYYYVAIFTLEAGEELLKLRSSTGKLHTAKVSNPSEEDLLPHEPALSLKVKLGEGIIGNVAKNGIEIVANDVKNNQIYRSEDVLPETRSEAAFPIKISDKTLGVLDVQSNEINVFHDENLFALRWLTDNIAIGIENSRLYVDLQKHLAQLQSIYQVSNAITSILNFDDLIDQVIKLTRQSLGYASLHFYSYNPTNGSITYQRGVVNNRQPLSTYDFQTHIDNERYSVSWVARNMKSLVIKNVTSEMDIIPTVTIGEKILSELVVPLIFAGDLLGILEIQSSQSGDFRDEDIYLVEALADNIAIALRNSTLYRSEQWRRKVADSLREMAGLLSADIHLDQVLISILSELMSTIPSDIATIWLLDEIDGNLSDDSILRLSAIRVSENPLVISGGESLDFDQYLGSSIDEFVEIFELDGSVKSWMFKSLFSKDPIIRNIDSPYEPIGAILQFDVNYSAISAPLKIGDRVLGVLILMHAKSGRYGENSRLLSTTAANYAAVAIENTRLYEAAHDQAWVSTVLLQVTQALQSIDSLDELLQTIVHLLPDLIGAKSCAILLWDDNVNSFIPSIEYGFTEQQSLEFDNWFIGESDVLAFDKVRNIKSPVFIDQAELSENNIDVYFSSFNFVNSLSVLFPMVTQNEVVGTILVDFWDDESQFPGEVSLWEEKIAIIQGIANQTAITIENLQLIKAQEEEAYVSIALLQVAQAVVSSNNLDEILSTIVRITPILVGIRRSIIYLWDETQGIFRVSQTYGFAREELSGMHPFYSPDEFYLLDCIRNNNRLIYHTSAEPSEPQKWQYLSEEDFSFVDNIFIEAEVDLQQKGLLLSKDPLLIGFPLAVKDKVLGVMLIEEADLRSGVPATHIREKRMEIITGITQQAAIAIQNDILQRDVVERERLEREMQLARDIQSTFLPDRLPHIDGWDIDVRWRPARQVGGDFFDVFVLPNNHLGIVIADVADKGMPAALYMTLVRTLIRAAILDNNSPKEVLERVNNLLVPDSRQGMFVTIVYAILSLDNGLLIYSNAGHNPPLSLDVSSGYITEHKRDAMALGVIQDIEINESRLLLDYGDLLLLYTDGITEAFSSIDELFGLDRLKELMRGLKYNSAAELLDEIESSVIKFSDGLSQSDDITLVALYRQN